MPTHYLVSCGMIKESDGIIDPYMEARERIGRYPRRPPDVDPPIWGGTPPGLVETNDEAEALLAEMQNKFPNRNWSITAWLFDDEFHIDWGR